MEYKRSSVFRIPVLTVKEMAEALGVSAGAIRARIRAGSFDYITIENIQLIILTKYTRSNMRPRRKMTML